MKLKKNKNYPYTWLKKATGIFIQGKFASFIFPAYDKFQLSDYLRHPDYDRKSIQRVFSYLRSIHHIKKNTYFIDVGANIGTHTIYALQEEEIDYAFCIEPLKSNIDILKANLKINNVDHYSCILPYALADFNTQAPIHINPINCGDNRLEPRQNSRNNLFIEENFSMDIISVKTLDQFILENNIRLSQVGLLWMDIQGAEGLVLHTSSHIKKTFFPIYIEFWPYGIHSLNSYANLRQFLTTEVKKFIYFHKHEVVDYSINDIDSFYYQNIANGYEVIDLLLLR